MSHGENRRSAFRRLLGAFLVRALLVTVSLTLAGLVLELALRNVPGLLPKGVFYGSGSFQEDLGFYLPTSTAIYNKARYVERTPNSEGFMDVEHALEKPPGTVRVGFFGDSFVESVQVPLEDTFFRRLPGSIAGRTVEPLAFGISGLGTLHALFLYRKYAPRYDLDVVVYLFVGNDPGDHFDALQRRRRGLYTPRPTARPTPGGTGFEVVPGATPGELAPWRRLAMAAKDRSLLVRLAYSRLQLLSRGSGSGDRLTAPIPPADWDEAFLGPAELLTRNLLSAWRDEAAAAHHELMVFYVPEPVDLDEPPPPADRTWRSWLRETCDEIGVAWIDPTAALAARRAAGEKVYGDHWTPAGHETVARVLAVALAERWHRGGAVPAAPR